MHIILLMQSNHGKMVYAGAFISTLVSMCLGWDLLIICMIDFAKQGIPTYGRKHEDDWGIAEACVWGGFRVHQGEEDCSSAGSFWNWCVSPLCRLPEAFLAWFTDLYTSTNMGQVSWDILNAHFDVCCCAIFSGDMSHGLSNIGYTTESNESFQRNFLKVL